MKILIIGSGGREHALAWKCAQSPHVEKVFIGPGNGGTAREEKCVNVPVTADPASLEGQEKLKQFALNESIDISVVGPEAPLAAGIVDVFRAANLAIIGPDKQAARLESSKVYSKAFMAQYGVRAAADKSFTDLALAQKHARDHFSTVNPSPLVIKADGLAAGKGVVVAQNLTEAQDTLLSFMQDKSLGDAGNAVLLEEFLDGSEVSVLAAVSVTGGKGYILPFIPARDHKRRFEGAQGPNTGGMGAVSPVPDFTVAAFDDFLRSIAEPTLAGMKAQGLDYRGFIFFGLMVKDNRCRLLEYNVRLGDPETQAVVPMMDFDFPGLCTAMLQGRDFPLAWKSGAACAPVAVAHGYPGPCRKGDIITIDTSAVESTGAKIFISGAAGGGTTGEPLRTSGGRVLTVSTYGATADEAYTRAYQALKAVSFEGMGFRTDIGKE